MLTVKTIKEAEALLKERFAGYTEDEELPLGSSPGRTLFSDVNSREFVPDFRRSMVDGYAVRAADTFGCSESTPAILRFRGEVAMGRPAEMTVDAGSCAFVPTGGQLPDGADAMVMLEYAEDSGDGTIGIQASAAPGTHMVFRGDDVQAGELVFRRGYRLQAKDIGALAALGYSHVNVFRRPRVAVFSTGDEIVPLETEALTIGQIRDVNGPMLSAAVAASGGEPLYLGIIPDSPRVLEETLRFALRDADMVLLSGGSSVGARDAAEQVLSGLGELVFHGLALKPDKPALAADIGGKPVFGLPGHPLAAYFIYSLLAKPLIYRMMDSVPRSCTVWAQCAVAIPSNHGREECVPVRLEGDKAWPVIGKSGLITTLSGAAGYIRIPRDAEGIAGGERVQVILFSEGL